MKDLIANALLWVVSKLLPLDEVLGRSVHNAAYREAAREARSQIKATTALQRQRLRSLRVVPHLITPEGATALVRASASSAVVSPRVRAVS